MSEREQRDAKVNALVLRAQAGDEHAFTKLVEQCYGQVHRWALAQTGDPDDADDVVQHVLVGLSTRLTRFRGESRFTTWLYRLTRNAAADHFRNADRRKRAEGRAAADRATVTTTGGAATRMEATETLDIVLAAYGRLPARQREVFDLVDLQGYRPSEVAEMLDMIPVTIRAHLHKARRAVRATILSSQPDFVEEYT